MKFESTYTLERLLGHVSKEQFMEEYWEKKPLWIKRGQTDFYTDLLTLNDLDRVITTMNLKHPEVSMTNAARRLQPVDYTYDSGLVDSARLYQQFADGSTVIFAQLDLRHGPLGRLCRGIEEELSARMQTNIYLTPASAQGFKSHYDSHDVFVLQVEGTKHWIIYDTPVELPFRGQEFNPQEIKPGPVSMDLVLEPGDLLYVPRGVMHDARTTDTTSAHITLGVLFTSWTELLLESLARVGLQDPAFRKMLPPGFARPGYDRTKARETFRALVKSFAEHAEFDGALDHFINDLISSRHPQLQGQLHQMLRLPALSLDSEIEVEPRVLYAIEESEENVMVAAYGSRFKFPKAVSPAVRFCLETKRYFVRDLPGGLDDPGKLTLVRRFVREGLVRLV